MAPKGINNRGYLPHWDFPEAVQAITFRLADALPKRVIRSWRKDLHTLLTNHDRNIADDAAKRLHKRIACYEDAGHGSCFLKEHGHILQETLISGHSTRYKLIEWCVMPNHVHHSLGAIIQSWKGVSSARINKVAGQSGTLWYPDYQDRFIRDFDHYHNAIAYIRNNPVQAGLCQHPSHWPPGSPGMEWSADFSPHLPSPAAPPTKDAD